MNFDGEIIGINTAVAEQAQGIGFAIPINDAKGLLQGVLKQGRIIKPFLGVQYVMLNASVANELNAGRQQGALVYGGQENPVVAGSPADKAGIRRGDIITHVNGKEVKDTAPLATQLNQFKPGDEVELTLVRDGKEQTVKVTLEEYK